MPIPSLIGRIAAAENGTFITKVQAAILSESLELLSVGSQDEIDTSLLFLNSSESQLKAHAKRFAQSISSLENFQAGISTRGDIDKNIVNVADDVIMDAVNETIQLMAGKVKVRQSASGS